MTGDQRTQGSLPRPFPASDVNTGVLVPSLPGSRQYRMAAAAAAVAVAADDKDDDES